MFNGLWPAFDEAEVPIGSITNGVHAPTWVAREVFDLAAAPGRRHADADDADAFWAAVDKVPGGRHLGGQAAAARAAGRSTPAGGCAKSWQQRGAAAAELGWIDDGARPRRAHDRVRAPRARRTSG